MNINAIKDAVQTIDREVEFKPAGISTGWFFTLRHESSPEVQKVIRVFRAKITDATFKSKTLAYQNIIAQQEDDLRMAHVVTWCWELGDDVEAGRPPYSEQELKDALRDEKLGYHLKKFIDEEVGTLHDFLPK